MINEGALWTSEEDEILHCHEHIVEAPLHASPYNSKGWLQIMGAPQRRRRGYSEGHRGAARGVREGVGLRDVSELRLEGLCSTHDA